MMETQNLTLRYTLLCDDVRIEMGNKISLMGIFQTSWSRNYLSLDQVCGNQPLDGEGSHTPRAHSFT